MGTIYIDLLVIINLYITFFMLKSAGVFLHRRISTPRALSGALAGGISSLIILLPTLPFFGNIALKIASGLLITLISFGYKSVYEYFKNALVFIIINIVFAGLTMLLWLFAAPVGMSYKNGYAYFDISFPALVISTAVAYGLIKLLRYILDTRYCADRVYSVEISRNGVTVVLDAIADSGNLLVDYFSGLPVIVCSENSAKPIIPHKVFEFDEKTDEPPIGFRLLPYTTINSSGLIPVFKADGIVIKTEGKPDKQVKALVGVTKEKEIGAIFNPKLLI